MGKSLPSIQDDKRAFGRPHKRTREEKLDLVQRVWLWMSEKGYSFRGACGCERLDPGAVMMWMGQLPKMFEPDDEKAREQFLNAIKSHHAAAHAAREAWLQNRLMTGSREQIVAAIFALKCSVGGSEEWRETLGTPAEFDTEGGDGTTRVNLIFNDPDKAKQQEIEDHDAA